MLEIDFVCSVTKFQYPACCAESCRLRVSFCFRFHGTDWAGQSRAYKTKQIRIYRESTVRTCEVRSIFFGTCLTSCLCGMDGRVENRYTNLRTEGD